MLSSIAESGVQYWSGHGGYDGSDSRRRVHGGKGEAGVGDGYDEPRKSGCYLSAHYEILIVQPATS